MRNQGKDQMKEQSSAIFSQVQSDAQLTSATYKTDLRFSLRVGFSWKHDLFITPRCLGLAKSTNNKCARHHSVGKTDMFTELTELTYGTQIRTFQVYAIDNS